MDYKKFRKKLIMIDDCMRKQAQSSVQDKALKEKPLDKYMQNISKFDPVHIVAMTNAHCEAKGTN